MNKEKIKYIKEEDYRLAQEIKETMSFYGLNSMSHKEDDPFIVDMIEFIKKRDKAQKEKIIKEIETLSFVIGENAVKTIKQRIKKH